MLISPSFSPEIRTYGLHNFKGQQNHRRNDASPNEFQHKCPPMHCHVREIVHETLARPFGIWLRQMDWTAYSYCAALLLLLPLIIGNTSILEDTAKSKRSLPLEMWLPMKTIRDFSSNSWPTCKLYRVVNAEMYIWLPWPLICMGKSESFKVSLCSR